MTAPEPTPAAAPCSGPKALPNDGRHFDKVTIRGFRGLEDLEIDGLGGFNLFVGANNVGKTSALEAVFLLCATNPMALLHMQNHRLLAVSGFDDLAMVFHGLNVDKSIELIAKSRDNIRRVSLSSADTWVSGQSTQALTGMQTAKSTGKKLVDISKSFGVDVERVIQWKSEMFAESADPPLSVTAQLRFLEDGTKIDPGVPFSDFKEIADRMRIRSRLITTGRGYESEPIAEIITKKRKNPLLTSLKGIDPQIQDITVRGDTIYLDTGAKEMLPMNVFGNGVGLATNIVAQCVLGDVDSIMIDEIENGLHYTAIRRVLGSILHLAVSHGIQVYATAHSIDVLKGLREILLEDEFQAYRPAVVCHVLAKDWKGRVRPYKYGYEQFDHCIKHEIEIR